MATVNGPAVMYKLKPYYESTINTDISACMYSLPNYHAHVKTNVDIVDSQEVTGGSDGRQPGGDDPVAVDTVTVDPVAVDPVAVDPVAVDPVAVDLEKRQHAILERLGRLQQEVNQLTSKSEISPDTSKKTATIVSTSTTAADASSEQPLPTDGLFDVVISANPNYPPLSVLVLSEMLSQQYKLLRSCHVHSSAITSIPEKLKSLVPTNGHSTNRNEYQLAITLIWKDVKHGPRLIVSPRIQTCIEGESNVARYLGRLLNPAYDATDIITATTIDQWLDQASQLIIGSNKERAAVLRTVNAHLGKASWLVGNQLSIADVVVWSAIQQSGQADAVPNNVKQWIQSCNNQPTFQTALKVL